MGAEMTEAQRVAVRRRSHRAPDADRAACARDVLDQDGLAERRLHALAEDAHHRIRGSTRRERHDDGDRTRGIVLGPRHASEREHRQQRSQNCPTHHAPPMPRSEFYSFA